MPASPDPAFSTYQAFAAIYNRFNHANDYEMWLGGVLLPELAALGLADAGSVLDVGCGTGRAFRPFLRRGWKVTGCDISPAMLQIAAREAPGQVALQVVDMRRLPKLGQFDLVVALNDSVDYLLGADDLVDLLRGIRSNLVPGGLFLIDTNSRSTYESGVALVREVAHHGDKWRWIGRGEVGPATFESEITGDGLEEPIRHLERFRPETEIRTATEAAGLSILGILGMSEIDGRVLLSSPPDESRDYKLVTIGERPN